jgi:hypothetical protein
MPELFETMSTSVTDVLLSTSGAHEQSPRSRACEDISYDCSLRHVVCRVWPDPIATVVAKRLLDNKSDAVKLELAKAVTV